MNTIRRLGAILVVAIALTGCQEEILTPDNGTKDLGHEIELTMSASMSDVVIPSRALTEKEENAITRLDVLVFKENTFAYTVQANTPTVTGSTLSYTVRLKKSATTEKYKLVLLANLTAAPTISVGTAIEAAMAAITFAPTVNWTTSTKIPMWADYPTAAVVTTSTTNTSFGTTAVIRSLARVNVTNTATSTSTFTLDRVWVYNSTDKARVAPVFSNYNISSKKVTAPSIAASAGITTLYSKSATSNKVEREIYIGESEDKPVGDASAVCLVLEGTLGGVTNFYRVDMVDADGKTPLDILRNHTYNVNITKVAGSGYSTIEDAFKSMPINMTVDIKVWNDANCDITDDGQYHLAVDKASVEVNGVAGTGSIAFKANHPTVKVEKSADTWLTITSSGNASPIEFSYEKNSSTTAARTAKITITAGRIVKEITITQAPMPDAVYVGMFGGAMIGAGTESDPIRFSQPLYVQTTDESASSQWATATGDHSLLAGSKIDGRANTWNLNTSSSTEFPAANLCFNKNSTLEQASEKALVWYLPAQEQLMSIWITHNGSGTSFSDNNYWSSSENTSAYSWYVNVSTGRTYTSSKTTDYRVRCVREVTP